MRHTFIRLFLVLVLTVSVYAQAQQRAVENSPGVERLRAHVTHLASDELEGRRTGTMGADKAARYIAGEFARQGLRPASKLSVGTNSRNESSPRADAYLQSFPFVAGVEAGRNNRMLFTPAVATEARDASRAASLDLRFGEDWMPLAWSANGNLDKLPVTFAGYGIKADALGWNDYANLDLKDRIVLIFTGTPDADNPHSEFAAYADLRRKAATAREQGARALVVVAKEENFKDDRLARLRFDHAGGGSVDAGLPVVVVSRASARRILENGGVALPLNELEKSLATLRNKNNPTGAQGSQPPHAARPNLSLALKSGALSIQIEVLRREVPAATVVGVLEGADARLKSEAIIIGAHYDHLGRGGAGSLAARGEDERGEIHHGADDNASGVAALLELASAFASAREKPRRTIIFIAFGGEEEGLLGSNYYVNHPVVPLAQTVAMINMDMIGRMKDNKLIVGGVGTAAEWRSIVHRANDELRLQLATGGRSGNRNSQNQSARNNVLVVGANGETVATAAESERFSLTLN
ncbi:MAG: M20/M25/M40 family metallo-hydrolase [Pyrinomonadaceae bacterium]|nr:M20/M25/M40 family metallo-hydrolase [Pyrinomonadaceae bacterium]